MRHKYETRGMVLSRTPLGEMSALVTLITPGLGLVRARAQSVRRPGAKLACALTTFAESSLVLVRGKESWRIAGAVLEENWFERMQCAVPRTRASRITGLVLQLVADETHDLGLFPILSNYFKALAVLPEEEQEVVEVLAALRILSALGLDAGTIPGEPSSFSSTDLEVIKKNRTAYIARINNGIAASGL